MTHASPTRCISSHLTSELIKIRNPQGAEENGSVSQIGNKAVFLSRVITTEIGVSLLVITSAIEVVSYSIFCVGSLAVDPSYNSETLEYSYKLLCSSFFTCYWNIGNTFVFNLCSINIITHESLARISIKNHTSGKVFRHAIATTLFVSWITLLVLTKAYYTSTISGYVWGYCDFYKLQNFGREEDDIYVSRIREIQNRPEHTPHNETFNRVHNTQIRTYNPIGQGANVLLQDILNNDKIDKNSKNMILDLNKNSFDFATCRVVYIYVYGDKSKDQLPSFLKPETTNAIKQLRGENRNKKLSQKKITELDNITSNWTLLDLNKENPNVNKIVQAAFLEHRGGVFMTKCFQNAITRHESQQDKQAQ